MKITLVFHYMMSGTCVVIGYRFLIRHAHKARRARGNFKVTCLLSHPSYRCVTYVMSHYLLYQLSSFD